MNYYKHEYNNGKLKKALLLKSSDEKPIMCIPQLLSTLLKTKDINILHQIIMLINSYFEAGSNDCSELSSLVNESHLNYLISHSASNVEIANDVLLFCFNISNFANECLLLFYSSQQFLNELLLSFQNQSPKVVEIAILLTSNMMLTFPTIHTNLIENMIINKIINIKLNDLIIFERKSWILALFLQNDFGDDDQTQILIYNQLMVYLRSKFDSVKCYSIKGFINAFDWSKVIVNYFYHNNVIIYLCNVLSESESRKLTRLTLILFQKLVKSQIFIQNLIELNFLDLLSNIILSSEDICSSICLDLIQTMISFLDQKTFFYKFDFSILLSFKNKGFIAKRKFIEFIFWFLKEEKFGPINSVIINNQIMDLINEVARCGDIDVCVTIINISTILENYEIDYLFTILTENGEFKQFLNESREIPEVTYMDEKILQVSQIFD